MPHTPPKKTGIPRLLEISGEKKGLLILSCGLSVMSTCLQFVPFAAVYSIVQELLYHSGNIASVNTEYIREWGLWALLALILGLLTLYFSAMAAHVAAFRILYGLRIRLAEHLAKLPMGYHTTQSSGAVKKILEYSVEKIEKFIAHQISDCISALVLPGIMLAAMLYLDWRLALACAVPIVAAFLLQGLVFFNKKSKADIQSYHQAMEQMNAAGVEYVRGMPAVKIFGMTMHSFLHFHSSIENLRDCTLGMARVYKHPMAAFVVCLSSLLTFILPVGVFLLSGQPDNQAFAVTLLLFLTIAPGLSVPVLKLLYLGADLRQVAAGVDRVDAILRQEPIPEPARPQTPFSYTVDFEDVGFSYASANAATRTEALSGISFAAQEKTMTALVGPSGSGKSTIASLLTRFWDVSSGRIRVGGIDIRNIGTERLMDSLSFVFQDVHLFSDTIEENIRMGRRDAGAQEIIEAARIACCHEFIQRLPQGYQTKIGEGGTCLSGGEAQRISIARAILKDSPILVLDEATAFADPENEVNIQQGLGALMRGKTVFVIAHRLSTIKDADQILVLDEGRIVERGRHKELLEQQGLYHRMWEAHVDAGDWALGENAGASTTKESEPATCAPLSCATCGGTAQ